MEACILSTDTDADHAPVFQIMESGSAMSQLMIHRCTVQFENPSQPL